MTTTAEKTEAKKVITTICKDFLSAFKHQKENAGSVIVEFGGITGSGIEKQYCVSSTTVRACEEIAKLFCGAHKLTERQIVELGHAELDKKLK